MRNRLLTPEVGFGFLLVLFFGFATVPSAHGVVDPPSIFLVNANLPRARALALDAALLKGWRLRENGAGYSLFETTLPRNAQHDTNILLRIRAEYAVIPPGVRVSLRAAEIAHIRTPEQTVVEVTERYRVNLDNALGSLRRQWNALFSGEDRSSALRAAGQAQPVGQEIQATGGIWRYHAHQHAVSHDCDCGESDLALQERDPQGETYAVYCYNGGSFIIRCDSDGCDLVGG